MSDSIDKLYTKLDIANEEIQELKNLLGHERERRKKAEATALEMAETLRRLGYYELEIKKLFGIDLTVNPD